MYELISEQAPSPQQNQAEKLLGQAEKLQADAFEQFELLELDVAIKLYRRSLQKIERGVAGLYEFDLVSKSLAMLGAAYMLMGNEKRARASFQRLLVINQDYQPDEAIFKTQNS